MQRKLLVATVLAALVAAALMVAVEALFSGAGANPRARAFPAPGRRTSERLFGCRVLRLAGLPRRS